MCLLYRHIRLDKNEPFYVGIGIDDYRSRSKQNRNQYWKNIVDITDYRIDILLEDLTWEEACKKEIEFITLYGRKDLKLGTLVNMTNGGEGLPGYKVSENDKKRKSLNMTGKGNHFYGKHHTSTSIEKIRKLAVNRSLHPNTLLALNLARRVGDNHHMKLQQYKDEMRKRKQKEVYQFDKDHNMINEYRSISIASSLTNIDNSSIGKSCMHKLKSAGGFIWEFKN